MPWNDQSKDTPPGGGPWGSGPRQPWGRPPRPKAPEGPDLEDMLRSLRERFRFGGGGGTGGGDRGMRGGPSGIALIGAALATAWAASGIYIVNQGGQAVVTRFGAFARLTEPGPHVHLPLPIEDVRIESTTTQRQTVIGETDKNESLMLTGDKSIIDINFTVIWQVSSVKDFVFNVREPESTVKAVAESAMREVIGKNQMDDVITRSRSKVEQETLDLMQKTLDFYGAGVRVASIQIKAARAPEEVNAAFQDVIKAGQDQITKQNEATAYANNVVPNARGQAAALLQDAEAYRERSVRDAEGEAQRFSSVLTEYKKAPRVTRQRLYLETMERIYGGADKIIIDGRGTGAVPYLPLDQLRNRTPAVAPPVAAPGTQR
ncbi:MAG TPA: FtsH protease activity modulator HflK [Caulobacterales bacterium]|nr:FtsH protease activity modulator HflK [Caulobacterales bacterium]